MRRRAILIVLVLSTAITAALEVRSCWREYVVWIPITIHHSLGARIEHGSLILSHAHMGDAAGLRLSYESRPFEDPGSYYQRWGFYFGRRAIRTDEPDEWADILHVGFPLWILVIAFGYAIWHRFHRKILIPGTCLNCGYDLRATPAGGGELLKTCPECGQPTTAPSAILRQRSNDPIAENLL